MKRLEYALLPLLKVKSPLQLWTQSTKMEMDRVTVLSHTSIVESQCDVRIDVGDLVVLVWGTQEKGA